MSALPVDIRRAARTAVSLQVACKNLQRDLANRVQQYFMQAGRLATGIAINRLSHNEGGHLVSTSLQAYQLGTGL